MANENSPKELELLSDIAHGVLDLVGELADGANGLFYLTEGNKTDAALAGNSCRGCGTDGFLRTYFWQSPKFWQSL